MGADIHVHLEVRNENGVWLEAKDSEKLVNRADRRNYSIFAMLADVRNGSGFGGTDIGDRIEPIAMPRGLPDDVSDAVNADSEYWGVDGHSHSYFTATELLAVPWTENKITHRSWIKSNDPSVFRGGVTQKEFARQFMDFANAYGETPDMSAWRYQMCGWSSEGLSEDGWQAVEWTVTWASAVGSDWAWFLVGLGQLAREFDDADSVRMVFWFDN